MPSRATRLMRTQLAVAVLLLTLISLLGLHAVVMGTHDATSMAGTCLVVAAVGAAVLTEPVAVPRRRSSRPLGYETLAVDEHHGAHPESVMVARR